GKEIRRPFISQSAITGIEGEPSSFALGDFDGNGLRDVAITGHAPDQVTVHAQIADRQFDDPVTLVGDLGSMEEPTQARSTDIDGDGREDLYVRARLSNDIALYFGSTTGLSSTPDLVLVDPLGDAPSLAGADHLDPDHDGRADLISWNGSAGFTLFVQTDDREFAPFVVDFALDGSTFGDGSALVDHEVRQIVPLGRSLDGRQRVALFLFDTTPDSNPPYRITTAWIDIVDTTGPVLDVQVAFGPIAWQSTSDSFVGPYTADLTRDGNLDLVVFRTTTGAVTLLPSLGADSFAVPVVLPQVAGPGYVTLRGGSVDMDDEVDLLFSRGTTSGSDVGIAENVGPSGPRVAQELTNGTDPATPIDTRAEDLDRDGRADVIHLESHGDAPHELALHRQLARGDFFDDVDAVLPAVGGFEITTIGFADLDGDERLDVIRAETGASSCRIAVHRQSQPRALQPFASDVWTFPGAELRGVDLADIDGDGEVEILAMISGLGPSGELHILDWDDGLVEAPPIIDPDGATSVLVETGDLDGDGRLDLLVANDTGLIAWLQTGRTGAIELSSLPVLADDELTGPVATIGDADGDGVSEIVCLCGAKIRVFAHDAGTFIPEVEVALAPVGLDIVATDIALFDSDEEGRIDIAASGFIASTALPRVWNLRQSAPGNYLVQIVASDSPAVGEDALAFESVDPADLDGDGRTDLIIAESTRGRVEVRHARWGGGFVDPPQLLGSDATTTGIRDARVVDLDRDGSFDLVTLGAT
ncbi:MAG: VCBS repeat-containing protein, partial [Planctomycetes bacterium]|nr:VCBS repeat-containing protein [Planctomycetota bacterium]